MRVKPEANGTMSLVVGANNTVTVEKNLSAERFVGYIFEVDGDYDLVTYIQKTETGATMTTGSGATAAYVAATGVITYTAAANGGEG